MADLVLTLIGPDRPGLVEAVASIIAAHGGNWVESRMTQLAGKFAGILRAEIPADKIAGAVEALGALEARGLRVVVETADRVEKASEGALVRMALELVGVDRPGIVREISRLLSESGVNVEELVTNRSSAPMSGEVLFWARATVSLQARTSVDDLRRALERAASDLMVDVTLEEPADAPPPARRTR
jgi:glycine cleavage system regulatory protein